jgi:uncharacterized coiled-coil protein SlyX
MTGMDYGNKALEEEVSLQERRIATLESALQKHVLQIEAGIRAMENAFDLLDRMRKDAGITWEPSIASVRQQCYFAVQCSRPFIGDHSGVRE